jgi:hypothetical protein
VYKFVGDMFGSGERRPVEAHLRRLQGMDPAISETVCKADTSHPLIAINFWFIVLQFNFLI